MNQIERKEPSPFDQLTNRMAGALSGVEQAKVVFGKDARADLEAAIADPTKRTDPDFIQKRREYLSRYRRLEEQKNNPDPALRASYEANKKSVLGDPTDPRQQEFSQFYEQLLLTLFTEQQAKDLLKLRDKLAETKRKLDALRPSVARVDSLSKTRRDLLQKELVQIKVEVVSEAAGTHALWTSLFVDDEQPAFDQTTKDANDRRLYTDAQVDAEKKRVKLINDERRAVRDFMNTNFKTEYNTLIDEADRMRLDVWWASFVAENPGIDTLKKKIELDLDVSSLSPKEGILKLKDTADSLARDFNLLNYGNFADTVDPVFGNKQQSKLRIYLTDPLDNYLVDIESKIAKIWVDQIGDFHDSELASLKRKADALRNAPVTGLAAAEAAVVNEISQLKKKIVKGPYAPEEPKASLIFEEMLAKARDGEVNPLSVLIAAEKAVAASNARRVEADTELAFAGELTRPGLKAWLRRTISGIAVYTAELTALPAVDKIKERIELVAKWDAALAAELLDELNNNIDLHQTYAAHVIAKGNVVDGLKGPNAGKGTFEYFHSVLEKELPIAHARRLIHRVLRGGFIGMDGNQIGSVGAHNISENWSFIAPKIIEVLVQESRGSVTQAQAEYALMIASKFMTITHEVAAQEYEMRSKKPYELRDLVHFPERVDYLFANGRKAAPDILRTFIFCNDKVWDALEEYFVKVMGLKESELVKPLILYNDLGTIAVTVEQTDSSRPLIKVEYASVHPPHPSSTFLQVFEDHTTPQKASVKYRYDGKGDGSFVYDTLGNSYRAAEAQWDKRGYVVGEGEMMWENVDWSIFSDEIYSSWTDHLFSVKGFMDELITKINFSAGELSQETFYSALKSKIDYTAKNAFVIREGQITLDFIMQQYGLLKRDKDGNIVFVLDEDAGKIAEDYQKMMAEYEALKPDQKDKKFKEYKGKHLALANRLAAHPAFEQRVQAKAFKEYSKFNDNQKKLAADTVALALQDKFVRSKDELQMAMQEMIMAAALVENYYRKHPGEPGRWKEFEDREATEILENAADAGFIRRSRIPWLLGQVQGLAMFREAFQHALSERLRKEGT